MRITKRVVRTGGSKSIIIDKAVADKLDINFGDLVEVGLRKL